MDNIISMLILFTRTIILRENTGYSIRHTVICFENMLTNIKTDRQPEYTLFVLTFGW